MNEEMRPGKAQVFLLRICGLKGIEVVMDVAMWVFSFLVLAYQIGVFAFSSCGCGPRVTSGYKVVHAD